MAHTTIIRHEGHQRHIDTKADNPGALPSSSATRKDDGVDERYGRSSVRGSSSSSLLLLFFFLLPSFLLLLLLPFSLLFSSPSFSSSLLPPSSLLLLPLSLSPCSFFLFLSPPCSSSSSCGRLGWGGEGARRGQRGELGGERSPELLTGRAWRRQSSPAGRATAGGGAAAGRRGHGGPAALRRGAGSCGGPAEMRRRGGAVVAAAQWRRGGWG